MEDKELFELLGEFTCATDEKFCAPVAWESGTLATDGKVIVCATDRKLTKIPPKFAPKSVLSSIQKDIDGYVSLPDLPPITEREEDKYTLCEECESTGLVLWTYKEHIEKHECPICKGEGQVKTGKTVKVPVSTPVLLDVRMFDVRYLHQIARLPELKVLPLFNAKQDLGAQLCFIWKYGYGALMPMHIKNPLPNKPLIEPQGKIKLPAN